MDFDRVYDRRGTNCVKHDLIPLEGRPEDTLPLWVADMDFPAPACVGRAIEKLLDHGIYGYSFPGEAHRKAVQGWFERRFGWHTEADWVVETPGVVFALCTAVRAFTKPGDAVMMLTPVYNHFFEAAEDNGRRAVCLDLKSAGNSYEIDFDALERAMDEEKPTLFLLCSPHNPAGRVWTRQELERLGRLCFDRGITVVADEIHCDFTYPGHPHTPFLSLGEEFEQNAISCTAPSKTFNLAGMQCSNSFIPNPVLRQKFRQELTAQGAGGINLFGRTACQAVYEEGDGWLDELLVYLKGNYDALCEFVAKELPVLQVKALEGTYLAWVDARGLELSDEARAALLRDKARVWLSDGAVYGEAGRGFWRINLASPRSVLMEALERLKEAIACTK